MSDEKPPSVGAKVLKSIGVLTAVISLVLGTRQIVNMIQENSARKSKAAELQAEATQLAASGLYSKAWETISQAVEMGASARLMQVALAMEWLRNVRISPNQKEQSFAEIVNKLAPVLSRAAIDTSRREFAATVRAHIAWAGYLLFKEGDRSVKVDEQFTEALRLDSTNEYANALYGFWLLYPGHEGMSINEANRHFAAALKSGQERKYIRRLMFSAYRNMQRADYQAQIIALANDMRKNNEPLERSERERILTDAYFMYRTEIMEAVANVMTPKEHLATFTFLTDGIDVAAKPYLTQALTALKNSARNE